MESLSIMKLVCVCMLISSSLTSAAPRNVTSTCRPSCTNIRPEDCTTVDCSGIPIGHIPTCGELLPVNCSTVTELNMTNTSIYHLTRKSFIELKNLRKLDLSQNSIRTLQNEAFESIPNLFELKMQHNTHENMIITKEVFKPLQHLKSLDLSWSPMQIFYLIEAFCHLTPTLSSLILSNVNNKEYNHVLSFTRKRLSCFGKLNLEMFVLDNNNINYIDFEALTELNLRSLRHLSVKNNKLPVSGIGTAGLFCMSNINLTFYDSSCEDRKPCTDNFPWKDWITRPPESYVTNAFKTPNVTYTDKFTITFFEKLEEVYVHHTEFYIDLPELCWKNSHLKKMDISFTKRFKVSGTLWCLHHLKFINLRGIPSLDLHPNTFHGMSSLEVLLLGSSAFTAQVHLANNLKTYFKYNKILKFLDLSDLNLSKFNLTGLFSSLKMLEILILSHNRLANVAGISLKHLQHLKYLDLSYNAIMNFPMKLIKQMENGTSEYNRRYLNLNNNQFLCICSDIDIIWRMLHSKVDIHDLHAVGGNLLCTLSNKTTISVQKAYLVLKKQCEKLDTTSIVFVAVLYPLVLIFMALLSISYKYKIHLEYLWYSTAKVFGKQIDTMEEDYNFDAFVAYSQKDLEWVRTTLVAKLEGRRNPYALCLHDRSFLPGQYIADNIVRAITASKHSILIVTKKFVRSAWCEFESRMAQGYQMTKKDRTIIAIVFPGAHKAAKKKPALCDLLDLVTYLEWSENKAEQKVFWLKLFKALGKPIGKNTDDVFILTPRN